MDVIFAPVSTRPRLLKKGFHILDKLPLNANADMRASFFPPQSKGTPIKHRLAGRVRLDALDLLVLKFGLPKAGRHPPACWLAVGIHATAAPILQRQSADTAIGRGMRSDSWRCDPRGPVFPKCSCGLPN